MQRGEKNVYIPIRVYVFEVNNLREPAMKRLFFCIAILSFIFISCKSSDPSGVVDENGTVTDLDSTQEPADKNGNENTVVKDDTGTVNDNSVADNAVTADDTADNSTAADNAVATDADNTIAGAYTKCDPAVQDSCNTPLSCTKGYDAAQYGQCLKQCAKDEDCPPPPDPSTMQVACNTKEGYCLILCGAHPSVCPDWLQCFGMEMCLPPSSVIPTKKAGETCVGKDECIGDPSAVDCISGQSGVGHCYPICNPNVPNDCSNKAPGFQAQCTSAGSFYFCMFNCQNGFKCPGDLTCIANMFCEG